MKVVADRMAVLQTCANKAQSNKWGTWHHCAVCNLRLDYTPKPGAPANTTACKNPTMVQDPGENVKKLPLHVGQKLMDIPQ